MWPKILHRKNPMHSKGVCTQKLRLLQDITLNKFRNFHYKYHWPPIPPYSISRLPTFSSESRLWVPLASSCMSFPQCNMGPTTSILAKSSLPWLHNLWVVNSGLVLPICHTIGFPYIVSKFYFQIHLSSYSQHRTGLANWTTQQPPKLRSRTLNWHSPASPLSMNCWSMWRRWSYLSKAA